MVLLLTLANVTQGFDQTSFRIRSMGEELQWVVDDDYTDVLRNPAAVADLSKSCVLTNLSNLTGGTHTPFDYEGNVYSGDAGSYLIGAFHKFDDWTVGAIADCWKSDAWEIMTREMNTDFSDYYGFGWSGYGYGGGEEGTWVTDFDNGTDTSSDDYRVAESKSGTSDEVASGRDVMLLFGRKGHGFRYDFIQSEGPNRYTGGLLHSYDLMEVGSNSAQEAVRATQQEATESDVSGTRHRLSYGMTREFGEGAGLDIVAGLILVNESYDVETRRKKQIDFDPDNDGVSHDTSYYDRYYNQYQYQSVDTYEGSSDGFGYELSARYTKQVTEGFRFRAMAETRYVAMESEDYRDDFVMHEVMTAFEGGTGFSNEEETARGGSCEDNTLETAVGIGGVLRPAASICVGFGVKWYHEYSETLLDLDVLDEEEEGTYKQESRAYLHRVSLPVGFEYSFGRRYAVRLGVNTSFYSEKYETSATGQDPDDPSTELIGVTSMEFASWNTTEYSYGFGWDLTESLHLDMMGMTDLTDIGSVLLALTMTY